MGTIEEEMIGVIAIGATTTSFGTVALYGPFFFFSLRTIGLRFSLYQKLSKLRKKNLAPLFCQFLS
jgi:hypothetical protein